jgi:hypothetical protein
MPGLDPGIFMRPDVAAFNKIAGSSPAMTPLE